ncbi:hypothetical protein [Corynebacterium phocae]|uniref:hypothetical protein n=1 Tax=Corynebacterium phocae TaxID=161895 RepID=UPI000951E770|nr:hypothetical protein [Corynebacterium phocae]KAA8727963.1 hypothetical protein F4V58_01035 [Corynebacterium phocae]
MGVHTCGYAPAAIRKLLADPLTTPDWVGLDIKALPQDIEAVIQRPAKVGGRCWESLNLLADAPVDMQVRTTVWRGSAVERNRDRLAKRVREYGYELVIQQARAGDGSSIVQAG